MNAIVTDFRTLNALQRAGYILLNGSARAKERHWTGWRVRVYHVRPGDKLDHWYSPFVHNGVEYRLEYFDGCFKPFVVKTGVPRPAFV
jgi:hypothetical protein